MNDVGGPVGLVIAGLVYGGFFAVPYTLGFPRFGFLFFAGSLIGGFLFVLTPELVSDGLEALINREEPDE